MGARARGSFEDIVVRRRAPGFTTRFIEREGGEGEKDYTWEKRRARERESSRLSRKGSNLVANRRKMFETGIGPRTSDEIPSGNIVPFPPFYLNDPCTEGKEREGVFDHRNRSSPRAYFFSFFFLFFEYNSKYGSISNFPIENSSELQPRSRHLKSLSGSVLRR